MSFPYLARTTLKYKSPHATDLSFAKDETIRVTGPSADDEDWLVGETLDGSKSGGFPKDFIVILEEHDEAPASTQSDVVPAEAQVVEPPASEAPPVPASAPAPPSPKVEPAALPQPTPTPASPITSPKTEQPPPPPAQAAQDTASSADQPGSPSKMTMKDRLAFFAAAQNKPSAPPPVKPKPAGTGLTWSQRQKLRQEQEEKEKGEREARGESADPVSAPVASTPAPALASPAPAPVSQKSETDDKGAGLSAADAASSIGQGGSLKERMAALRAGGAFGAPAEEKPTPPKPAGKVWSRPAAPEPEPEAEEDLEQAGAEKVKSPEGEQADPLETRAEGEGGGEEETEEEKEKARRAAIAARMAKLGARGPMGMALPPKPARKPTREVITSPPEEKNDPAAAPPIDAEAAPDSAPPPGAAPSTEPTPPTSVPIAAIPRRAAPPRRRGPTAPTTAPPAATAPDPAEDDKRLEGTDSGGDIEPPPQVMVANEEDPLPKTDEQIAEEKRHEEAGRGQQGALGAAAAGIAMSSVDPDEELRAQDNASVSSSRKVEPDSVGDRLGSTIVSENDQAHEIEDGLEEGGAEKDDIMKQAASGRLDVRSPPVDPASPRPVAVVPLHAPAEDSMSSDIDDEDDAPPPPPHRPGMADLPKDEVELKHEHDAAEAGEEDEDEDDVPPPPPRAARAGSDRPLGPRPLPSPGKERALPPPPIGNPLVPPRDEDEEERELEGENDEDEEENAPPPPPRRQQSTGPSSPIVPTRLPPIIPQEEEETDDVPPPPPRRASMQVPPPAASIVKREDNTQAEPDPPAPPPPQRKPSLPAPIQTGVPIPLGANKSAIGTSPTSPKIARSPSLVASPRSPSSEVPRTSEIVDEDDEEKTRRSGIAARMAKLGGIKFGMPPPATKKGSTSSDVPTSPVATKSERQLEPAPRASIHQGERDDTAESPEATEDRTQALPVPTPAAPIDDQDESPEAEAARRRATLARLRAGGSLGFGMFNHGPAKQEVGADQRGLEEGEEEAEQAPAPQARQAVPPTQASQSDEEDEDGAPPPPPPGRPSVPTTRPSLPAPPPVEDEDEDEDSIPPPPPATRPRTSQEIPVSPTRSMSGSRPPVPHPDRRLSGQYPSSPVRERKHSARASQDLHMTEEPAIMMMNQGDDQSDVAPAPPPGRRQSGFAPPIQTQPPVAPSHQRSASTASRTSFKSRLSMDSPSGRQGAGQYSPAMGLPQERLDQQLPPPPGGQQGGPPPNQFAPEAQSGGRPGYDTLVAASRDGGSRLARAARAMFDQGKKAYYGDGSPKGFVLVALENAHLGPPQNGWGQLVYEQQSASVVQRYDEPRAGDIAAFHDAKLKGRKGLHSYDQHVGSVQEPLLGIVVEFESKNKHKIKVLQVDRGVPEEVSYRLDDLKSGRVMVYRPGI